MSYDSAILIRLDQQESVTIEKFIEFSNYLLKNNLIVFDSSNEESVEVEYFYSDYEADEEEEDYIPVESLEDIRDVLASKKLDFCTLAINHGHEEFELEIKKALGELENLESSSLKPACEFRYGFGNVLDPAAGEYKGWSFFIDTQDYAPDFEVLQKGIENGSYINTIRSNLENIFNCKTIIEACITG